jgi:hypothetical protein
MHLTHTQVCLTNTRRAFHSDEPIHCHNPEPNCSPSSLPPCFEDLKKSNSCSAGISIFRVLHMQLFIANFSAKNYNGNASKCWAGFCGRGGPYGPHGLGWFDGVQNSFFLSVTLSLSLYICPCPCPRPYPSPCPYP